MIQELSESQVMQRKKEMISWVTKQIKNDTFGLVYQILWQLKTYFDRLDEQKLTPEQRMRKAKRYIKSDPLKITNF